jgi:hypothetical protein
MGSSIINELLRCNLQNTYSLYYLESIKGNGVSRSGKKETPQKL